MTSALYDPYEGDGGRLRSAILESEEFWRELYWNLAIAIVWVGTRSYEQTLLFYSSRQNASFGVALMLLTEPMWRATRLVEQRPIEALAAAFRRGEIAVEGRKRSAIDGSLGVYETIHPREWKGLTDQSGLELACDCEDPAAAAVDKQRGNFLWRYRELRIEREQLLRVFPPLEAPPEAQSEPLPSAKAVPEFPPPQVKSGRKRTKRDAAKQAMRAKGLNAAQAKTMTLKELGVFVEMDDVSDDTLRRALDEYLRE